MTAAAAPPSGPPGRAELARLGREHLLAGHLMDRAGMPHVIAEHGREVMEAVAIEEWMAASPVYTRRMQRLLGVEGDGVAAIFKGMQLDIGAPPEFMDFRYRVHDRDHGEFWLASCGALMDVEPLGDDYVVSMCHHIEDPTFDATACATNPRARVRPLHRPPRRPADRHPHCHWTVTIDDGAEPLPEPELARDLAATSVAAQLDVVDLQRDGDDGGHGRGDRAGWSDYAGDFDPDLQLEAFSRDALLAVVDEVCLQGHLLSQAFAAAVGRHRGPDAAHRALLSQFTGIAGLTAERLGRLQGPGTTGLARVAAVLDLHPAFRPRRYVDLRIDPPGAREGDGERELVVAVGPSPALDEPGPSWIGLLAAGHREPLEAAVHGAEPRARVHPTGPPGDAVAAWRITLDPAAEPTPVTSEVVLASFSTGAGFRFREGQDR